MSCTGHVSLQIAPATRLISNAPSIPDAIELEVGPVQLPQIMAGRTSGVQFGVAAVAFEVDTPRPTLVMRLPRQGALHHLRSNRHGNIFNHMSSPSASPQAAELLLRPADGPLLPSIESSNNALGKWHNVSQIYDTNSYMLGPAPGLAAKGIE